MGAFDDLVPKASSQEQGAFDDLIPAAKPAKPAAPARLEVPELTVGSAARDIASGVLQIGPTAVKGVADIARLATGDRIGTDTSKAMERGMAAIRDVIGSERAAAQRANFQADMADDSAGIGETLARNKGAIADMILPTIGSMILPVGVVGAAGKLASAGRSAQAMDKATLAARVANAQQVAGVSTTAAQNAASTFAELVDKGVPMERAYLAAGITVPFSVVAGVLSKGGAEVAIGRALAGGTAARLGVKPLLGATLREGGQEMGEEAGQIVGEAAATEQLPSLPSAAKQLAVAGTLGAVMGGGVDAAQQGSELLRQARTGVAAPPAPPVPAPASGPVPPAPAPAPAPTPPSAPLPAGGAASQPDPAAAQQRLAEIATEDQRLAERLVELDNPANGYGPVFDVERGDLARQRAALTAEAEALQRALGGQPAGAGTPPPPPGDAAGNDLQNRDRSRLASIQQMQSIARNPDYLRLGPSRSPDTGAPLVFATGDDASAIAPDALGSEDIAVMSDGQRVPFRYAVVDASLLQPSNFYDGRTNPAFADATPGLLKALNNGRTAGLRGAYEMGTAGEYATDMAADARSHGVDPEVIRRTPNPVLVRLYSEGSNTANMGARSQAQGLGMSVGELARQDAPLLDASVLSLWQGGDVTAAANRDFVRGFMGKLQGAGQDIATLVTADGALSPAGRVRIQAAMSQSAFGDSDLIAEMFDSTDTDIKGIGEALKGVAGEWANMRDSARSGAIDQSYDITDAVIRAIGMVRKARAERGNLYNLSRQTDITTGDTPDPMVLGALRLFYSGEFLTRAVGAERLGKMLREYARQASAATQGAGLFGDTPSPADMLAAVTTEARDGQQGQQGDQADPQRPAGSGQPGGGSPPGGAAGAGGNRGPRPGDGAGGAQPSAGGRGPLANANPGGQAPAPVGGAGTPAPGAPASAPATTPGGSNEGQGQGQGRQEVLTPSSGGAGQQDGAPARPGDDNRAEAEREHALNREAIKQQGIKAGDWVAFKYPRDKRASAGKIMAVDGELGTLSIDGSLVGARVAKKVQGPRSGQAMNDWRQQAITEFDGRPDSKPAGGKQGGMFDAELEAELARIRQRDQERFKQRNERWLAQAEIKLRDAAKLWEQSPLADRINAVIKQMLDFGPAADGMRIAVTSGFAMDAKIGRLTEDGVAERERVVRLHLAGLAGGGKPPRPVEFERVTLAELSEMEPDIMVLPSEITRAMVGRYNELGPRLAALGFKHPYEVRGNVSKEAEDASRALRDIVTAGVLLANQRVRADKGYKNANPARLQQAEDFATEQLGINTRDFPGLASGQGEVLTTQTPEELRAKAEREEAAAKAEREEQERLRRKQEADAQLGEFTLTGSDRPADAPGQNDMFGNSPAAAPSEPPAPAEPTALPPRLQELQEKHGNDGLQIQVQNTETSGDVAVATLDGNEVARVSLKMHERNQMVRWSFEAAVLKAVLEKLGISIDKSPDAKPDTSVQDAKQKRDEVAARRTRASRDLDAAIEQARAAGATNIESKLVRARIDFDNKSIGPARVFELVARAESDIQRALADRKADAEEDAEEDTEEGAPDADAQARAKAQKDLDDALGDLGDILGKGTRASVTPEQEQKLLPVLTRVMDAAFRLGYFKFKDAARFVIDTVRSKLGGEAADQITLDHLQAAYIGMAGRYAGQGANTKREVIEVESLAELNSTTTPGTRLEWSDVNEWIKVYRELKGPAYDANAGQQFDSHLAALTDEIIERERHPWALRALQTLFTSERKLRPGRGQRESSPYVRVIAAVNRTLSRLEPGQSRLDADTDPVAKLVSRIRRYASGLSALGDLDAGLGSARGSQARGVGVDVGELSANAIKSLAWSVINQRTAVFIDSGAFSAFRRGLKLGVAKPLNFDAILDKYDRILEAIEDENPAELTPGRHYPLPLMVMPDIVGDQAGSIELVRQYKRWISVEAQSRISRPIVPIQVGDLSLAQAYREIVDILGTDNFIVGIPSNERAASQEQFTEFLREAKPKAVHILGAASDRTLKPRLASIIEAGMAETLEVTADASPIRSAIIRAVAAGATRGQAIEDFFFEPLDEPPATPPESAANHARDLGGRVVWFRDDLALIQGFSLLSGDPVFIGAKGDQRTRVDVSGYTGTLFTPQEREELLAARAAAVRDAEAIEARNPDGPFTDSQRLVFAPDISDKVAGVIRGWVPMLGLEGARIVVTTPESGAKMAEGLAGRFWRIGKANLSGVNVNGLVQPLGKGDYHIAIRPGVSTLKQLETVAHELGHIVEREALAKASPELQAEIKAEHQKWLQENRSGPAIDMARAMRAFRSSRSVGDFGARTGDQADAYWRSFGEWFADQVARWATTQDKPLSAVERFFKRLADRLRTFFVGERSKFLPTASVARWLDSLAKDVPPPGGIGNDATPPQSDPDDVAAQQAGFRLKRGMTNEWGAAIESTLDNGTRMESDYTLRRVGGTEALGPRRYLLRVSARFPDAGVTGAPSIDLGSFDGIEAALDAYRQQAAIRAGRKVDPELVTVLNLTGLSDQEIAEMPNERRIQLAREAEEKARAVVFDANPPGPGVEGLYIGTGDGEAMFTLRRAQMVATREGRRLEDSYVRNLSRDRDDAIRKARIYAAARGIDRVMWGAPDTLADRQEGAGQGGGTQGLTDTSVPTTPEAVLAGAGLSVHAQTSKAGKPYWSVTGNTREHEAILDALGFARPFKMGGKWHRSVFDADPTQRLVDALRNGLPDKAAGGAAGTGGTPGAGADGTPAPEATDADREVLRQARIEVTKAGGDWVVTGKTFEIKDTIRSIGGRWNGKAWSFGNDPTVALAAALKERGSGGAAADDAGAGDVTADDERLRELRQREDARDDERESAGDVAQYVGDDTKALIRRGERFGIPREIVDEQIEDVGLIVNAHSNGKPLFILANEAGTGKTFVLGGAIKELLKRGETRFVYVTMNTDLIAQIKRDLAEYGADAVEFRTYAELSTKDFDTAGAILIFDEAHNVKNVGAETARANKAQDLIAAAKMTIFASATPFENPVEARYLNATGVYDSVGGFTEWAKMYGASVKKRKFYNPRTGQQQTEEIIYWAGRGKKEDGAAARAWLFKQAVMTQRAMRIPQGMTDTTFRRVPVAQDWVELYNQVVGAYEAAMAAWTTEDGMPRDAKIVAEISRHRENAIKRVLEASKIPAAIDEARKLLDAGRSVVVFVETKAQRHMGRWRRSEHFKDDQLYTYDQVAEMMDEWQREANLAKMMDERAPPRPFAEFIVEIARYFNDAGIDRELPSTSDEIIKALGADNVAVYTGSVTNTVAARNKADFMAGRKRVLVATMAKGGTGLSLHDTVGNRPTSQLNINLPWKATGVDQVAARVARYGLQSRAEVFWMFASNIPWEATKLAPKVGARMREMGAIVKGVELRSAEMLDGQFDFEGDVSASGFRAIAAPAEDAQPGGDIYERAQRLERTRRKADDTSGGFFETPFPLAALMTRVAGVAPGQRLLEPSAGRGNLLRLLPEGVTVVAVEARADNVKAMSANPVLSTVEIVNGDFMQADLMSDRGFTFGDVFRHPDGRLGIMRGSSGERVMFIPMGKSDRQGEYARRSDLIGVERRGHGGKFDTVLMNPPFERIEGVGAQDAAHVQRAYDMLAPGGRLVAIMGEGVFFRSYKQETLFREWLEERGATVIELPEGAFKQSGTMVRTRMVVIDRDAPAGRTDIKLGDLETASLQAAEAAITPREALDREPPGAAMTLGEERRVYRVRDPQSSYDLSYDLFPETNQELVAPPQRRIPAVPAASGGSRPGRRKQAAGSRDVDPAPVVSIREAPGLPGLYKYSSQLVAVGKRDLAVARVKTWDDAANALSSLNRYAVEHFDVLITDKDGRPLAVVGSFKGAQAQAAVFPETVLAEALRIEGATDAWAVHNHPSGNPDLSYADRTLSSTLGGRFDPSTIAYHGIAAVGDTRWVAETRNGGRESGDLRSGGQTVAVPIVERIIERGNAGMPVLVDPKTMHAAIDSLSGGKPGIVFMDQGLRVSAWVPINPSEMSALRKDGRYSRLVNAASQAGATGAVISNPNSVMTDDTIRNVITALEFAGVRTLDVAIPGTKSPRSWAQRGKDISSSYMVFARTERAKPKSMQAAAVREIADAVAQAWASAPPIVVVQSMDDPRIDEAVRLEDAKQRAAGAANTPQAFFLGGTVYLVADGLANPREVVEALAHEALGHYGLRAAFGSALDGILDQLAMARPDLMRPKAAQYGAVLTLDAARQRAQDQRKAAGRPALAGAALERAAQTLLTTHRRTVAEEVLAGLAQTEPTLGFVRRAVAAIRTWLRANVPALRGMRLTDAEIIRSWIVPAREFVQRGTTSLEVPAEAAFNRNGVAGARERSPLGFYSALTEAVANLPMGAAPAKGWKEAITGLVNKGRVKADEVEWSGVLDWLDLQQGKVMRDQVADYLRRGGVRVEEVVMGDGGLTPAEVQEVNELNDLYRRSEEGEEGVFDAGDFDRLQFLEERKGGASLTRYGEYALPGGENYRELVLTIPRASMVSPIDRQELNRLNALDLQRNLTKEEADARAEIERRIDEARQSRFISDHWPGADNPVVHLRVDDRTDSDGKRVLFIQELQSDWGQQGREHGFIKQNTPKAEVERLLEAAREQARVSREHDLRYDAVLERLHAAMQQARSAAPSDKDAADRRVAELILERNKLREEGGKLLEDYRAARDAYDAAREKGSISPGPFVTNTEAWVTLGLKRIITLAAEGGYDRVAFVTGLQAHEQFPEKNEDGETTRGAFSAFYGESDGAVVNDDGKAQAGKVPIVQAALKKLLPKVGGGQVGVVTLKNGRSDFDLDELENATPEELQQLEAGGVTLTQPGFDITPAMRTAVAAGVPLFQRAFHGTPHRGIQRFSTEFIGTGEGAQAYGWGLYFASRPEIAEHYRKSLTPRGPATLENALGINMSEADALWAAARVAAGEIESAVSPASLAYARSIDLRKRSLADRERLLSRAIEIFKEVRGQLYEVEIPEDSEMLLWDKPLSEQPEAVKKALKDSGLWKDLKGNLSDYSSPMDTRGKLKGSNIYAYLQWKLGSDKDASMRLLGLGVLGIKYPAGMIAGVKSANYNYVVFSGDDVAIERAMFSRVQRPADDQLDADIAAALEELAYQGYELPETPRVQAGRRLRTLGERLAAGEITESSFVDAVRIISAELEEASGIKRAKRTFAPRARGADVVRERLLAARRRGDLDADGVEFAMWAIGKNPALAEGLGISIRKAREGEKKDSLGAYSPAAEIMKIFKGPSYEDGDTIVHEIMHHAERMMPPQMQSRIRLDWAKALAKAIKGATPEQALVLNQVGAAMAGDADARRALRRAFRDGVLTYEPHYQLLNPSEFWAVNAARLLGARFASDTAYKRIRTWLREMLERVKTLLGARANGNVIRAMEFVLDPGRNDGWQRSQRMLFDMADELQSARTVRQGRIRRTIDSLVELAQEQATWKDWYSEHQAVLRELFGDDADLFQAILSATSQMQTVKGNVTVALRAYEQMVTGQPFKGYLEGVIRNLERIRAGATTLTGPKIGDFQQANVGDDAAMAIDRHIAQLLFNTSTPSRAQIESAKKRIRIVAARLGWTPRQAQAALWAANQVRLGTQPSQVVSYASALEAKRDVIAALRSRLGRGGGASLRPGGQAAAGAGGTGQPDGRGGRPDDRGDGQGQGDVARFSRVQRGPAGDPVARAEAIITQPTLAARPLDRLAQATATLTGAAFVARQVYRGSAYLLDRLTPERVRAGLVSDYGVPEAVIDQRVLLQGRQRVQLRKAAQFLEKLATMTRAESRVAYEWMNMDGSDPRAYISMMQGLPEESVMVLTEVQQMIDSLSREAVRLGQLDPRSYERLKFAYLRRTYERYLDEMTPLERAQRQRAVAILGDQYRGRGLLEPVPMSQMRAADPEWWDIQRRQGRADADLVGRQFLRLERRANAGEGTRPLAGMEGRPPGRVLEVAYVPADRPVPARYADWAREHVYEARNVKGDKLVLWRDFDKDEREKMGEIDEARFAIARTLQRMIHDVEVGRYLEWLAQNQSVVGESNVPGTIVEASEGYHRSFKAGEWVQVPTSLIPGTTVLRYGKLAGRYVPGPIWNDVRQIIGGKWTPLGQTYDAILRAWKVSKTALSPGVHTNNIMANLVMADWHDVGATHVAKALRIVLGASERAGEGVLGRTGNVIAAAGIPDAEAAREVLNRYRDSGGDIGSWATQELAREQMEPLLAAVQAELTNGGAHAPGAHIGVMAALQHLLHLRLPQAWDAFAQSKPAQAVGREGKALIDLYQAEDDVFRLAAWLAAKEQGATDIDAGRRARKSFLDYDINAPWIEAMRRTGWPFIAFTYRAVPMLADIAGNKPHKILKLLALAGAVNALGVFLAGGGDDEERKLLPEEKAGGVWGIVPKLIRMPWNDEHGSPVYLDIRRWVPVGDIVDTGQNHAALPVPPALMPGGPLMILGEVAFNKSSFTGKELVKETDTAGESALKVIDHLYKAFAPNILGLPFTYATTGVWEAARGRTDVFGREQSTAQAVASAFGVKVGSYPADALEYNQQSRTAARVRELQGEIRAVGRRLQTNRITEAEHDQEVESLQLKIQREQDRLDKVMAR